MVAATIRTPPAMHPEQGTLIPSLLEFFLSHLGYHAAMEREDLDRAEDVMVDALHRVRRLKLESGWQPGDEWRLWPCINWSPHSGRTLRIIHVREGQIRMSFPFQVPAEAL